MVFFFFGDALRRFVVLFFGAARLGAALFGAAFLRFGVAFFADARSEAISSSIFFIPFTLLLGIVLILLSLGQFDGLGQSDQLSGR